MPTPTRREALCGACSLSLLVACEGSTTLVPSATDALPTNEPETSVTPTDDPYPCEVVVGTAAEGWVRFGYDAHPQLGEVLGAAYVSFGGTEIVIAHVEPGCFIAMERACTHEGVLIDYIPARNGLVCPRHGAVYAWDGRVIAGPAPQDLVVYEASETERSGSEPPDGQAGRPQHSRRLAQLTAPTGPALRRSATNNQVVLCSSSAVHAGDTSVLQIFATACKGPESDSTVAMLATL